MEELNTISDSKELFYKEFPYVIPHVFRKVADEILVELHLLKHQSKFSIDTLFSLGLIKAFDDLTKGYKPIEHLDKLFDALCKCNMIDPSEIRSKSEYCIEKSKELSIEDLRNADDLIKNNEIFKTNNEIYNRLNAIGVYMVVETVTVNSKSNEEINKEQISKEICSTLNYPSDRVDKDLSFYLSSVEKIKQALELIELINKKS